MKLCVNLTFKQNVQVGEEVDSLDELQIHADEEDLQAEEAVEEPFEEGAAQAEAETDTVEMVETVDVPVRSTIARVCVYFKHLFLTSEV